jgi:hypothetical protein
MNAETTHCPLFTTAANSAVRGLRSRWPFVGLFALALASVGCVARATTRAAVVVEEPVVEVATVPVMIESYPRHYYRGSYVYLVDGRWYYHARGRWVVYRTEPQALVSVRLGYEAKARTHYQRRPEAASPEPRSRGKKKGHHKD